MTDRVTLKDVAARAQVSYQTVSKVLNRQTRVSTATEKRIHDAVRALGYTPDQRARNLRAQRSYMLGYSWRPDSPNQVNPILDLFMHSMVAAADAVGYHILPFPHPDPEDHIDKYRDLIRTGRVDGFVLSSVEYQDSRIRFLQREKFPFVAFGGVAEPSAMYVDVDGTEGMRLATAHLIAQGHTRIAALGWPKESRVGELRLAGYVRAMRDAKLPVRARWVARGTGSVETGYQATQHWLQGGERTRPTAIVAVTDVLAIGAMRAIQESGLRVGADIGVTGFDDTPLAQYLTPGLSSVRQPIWQAGQNVIDLLVHCLEQEPLAQTRVVLNPELVIRPSSLLHADNTSEIAITHNE